MPIPGPGGGFSLIELLVVIAIIAVLAGMLLPTVRIVRERATRADCSGHLRSWGCAIIAWTGERGGVVPSTLHPGNDPAPQQAWLTPTTDPAVHPVEDVDMQAMADYMGEAPDIAPLPVSTASLITCPRSWRCPSWKPLQPNVYKTSDWWYTIPGYLYYGQFIRPGWSSADALAYTNKTFQASRLVMTDWTYFYYSGGVRLCHEDGQNQLFGDGHVAWRAFTGAEAAAIAIGASTVPSVTNFNSRFYR